MSSGDLKDEVDVAHDEGYDEGYADAWAEAQSEISGLKDEVDYLSNKLARLEAEIEELYREAKS